MTWATSRKVLIISILVAIGLAIVALIVIPFVYKAPTCFDGRQNNTETGIDCGGTCAVRCTAQEAPTAVRFVRAVSPAPGRVDVIAYIDNSNTDAGAKGVSATVEIYDASHALLQSKQVHIDLPPSSTVPLFIPNFYQGNAVVSQAFITIDQSTVVWDRTAIRAPLPTAGSTQFGLDVNRPVLTGVLSNPTAQALYNTSVVAVVYDANNTILGASGTLVLTLPSQGTAPLTFTWNQSFSGTPVRAELLAVPVLGVGQ